MRAIAALGVLALAACSAGDTTTVPAPVGHTPSVPAATATAPATGTSAADAAGRPQGVALVAAQVTSSTGDVCDLCAWLADTGAARERGLMGVTDLGPAAAMAFVYPAPTSTWFWMKNTPMPLSIAFFDAAGAFLDSFDMPPCDTAWCPSYRTPDGFTYALEVPQGTLPELLVGPGSTLALLDRPCALPLG